MNAIDTAQQTHDCAAEPIQYPGAIQPHGYLISCVLPDWTIRHVSANVAELFDLPTEDLLGQGLQDYLTEELRQPIADVVNLAEPGSPPLRAVVGNVGALARMFDISVHVNQGLVHLEFEPRTGGSQERAPSAMAQAMIARVAAQQDMAGVYQQAVEQLRQLIGFDRVMVYRFLPDGAGEVIAESREDDLGPLLGLRFPESDIPAQARELYVRNRMRVIPDTGYAPVPVLPPAAPDERPLDMGMHLLRSVSPVHLQYTRNMGVAASMSISLVSGGRLWGLIACHHRTPRPMMAGKRAAAELFGMFLSMRVSATEQENAAARDDLAREVRENLWRKLASTRHLNPALTGELEQLARSLDCDGVAVLLDGKWSSHGHTPDEANARYVRDWLTRRGGAHSDIFSTHVLDEWCTGDCVAGDVAGLLAIRLGNYDDWLLFFRNEQVEDVRWAGEPVKAVESVAGRMVLKPRERFEAWREVIRGRSVPWSDLDRRVAERLRQLLAEFRARAMAASDDTIVEMDANMRRRRLREHRSRLEQLSALFDGLVHLDEAETARLSERISLLEAELRALAAAVPTPVDRRED